MSSILKFNSKFFTILCFIIVAFGSFTAQGQLMLRDTSSGKTIDIPLNSTISYLLISDSVLQTEIYPDQGIISTFDDSTLFFADGTHISISDLSQLEIINLRNQKWRNISSPFLVISSGFLIRGVTMLLGEGLESKNSEIVPFYLISGGTGVLVSSIPFWKKNKKFDLKNSSWTIVVP